MFYSASISATSRTSGSWLNALTGDARSSQFYNNSQFTILNAPINIGVRSSQQRASGSNTYVNRFHEGSEYNNASFGETTMSAQQTYVSSSLQ